MVAVVVMVAAEVVVVAIEEATIEVATVADIGVLEEVVATTEVEAAVEVDKDHLQDDQNTDALYQVRQYD